jgi:hypothetical protein
VVGDLLDERILLVGPSLRMSEQFFDDGIIRGALVCTMATFHAVQKMCFDIGSLLVADIAAEKTLKF